MVPLGRPGLHEHLKGYAATPPLLPVVEQEADEQDHNQHYIRHWAEEMPKSPRGDMTAQNNRVSEALFITRESVRAGRTLFHVFTEV